MRGKRPKIDPIVPRLLTAGFMTFLLALLAGAMGRYHLGGVAWLVSIGLWLLAWIYHVISE